MWISGFAEIALSPDIGGRPPDSPDFWSRIRICGWVPVELRGMPSGSSGDAWQSRSNHLDGVSDPPVGACNGPWARAY